MSRPVGLSGIHHVSAVSAHISRSHAFYTGALGMRPIIRTVNQDDPSMYHMFYGDGVGSPGSDMTIFDIRGAVRERRGNNSITQTTFRVAGIGSLEYWRARLDELRIEHSGIHTRDSRAVLQFDDVEGTRLCLVDDGGHPVESFAWNHSPVPAGHQIRGLGYIVLTVPSIEPTRRFLIDALLLDEDHVYVEDGADVHVFRIGDGGANAEVHVIVRPDLPPARHGAGGVHHVALRVPSEIHMPAWLDHLTSGGWHNSGIVDRHYFRSIYVREPNRVLFELASDGPGFEVDGPLDADRLSLPPFLEPRRAQIEAQLKPL